ncbi:sacsin N-terminal ATP-binding-like domain-containing protein [Streptomyces sp. NPDC127069]|uniref:sacsin N-terminal ATP-binding-like domain-containing protein n=1 Tax=Streptomyces sp. NPDC127069 TaxID=3347128 RepID=UPI0036607FA6
MDALAAAAHMMLEDPHTHTTVEVSTLADAARIVRLLDEGLRGGLGVHRMVAEGARRGAGSFSADPLQVLSEFVQNSDDAGAGQLRIMLRSDELLIAHDGAGLHAADLLLLGMPWLSGKEGDATATGRFGIGLSTLRALTTVWEVHCHPFHVRFSGNSLEPVSPPKFPAGICGPEWTVFRIPMTVHTVTPPELFTWFAQWSDASLLFLCDLRRIEVTAGELSTVLTLSWEDVALQRLLVDGAEQEVKVQHARATDGSVWRVYTAHVPPHADWKRSDKALGTTVPVGVALPLAQGMGGSVHAGLPVAALEVATRVHSQFDPVANREGFTSSHLNAQLVPVIADLWAAGVRDVLEGVDPTAWHLIPLPRAAGSSDPNVLQSRIHAELLDRARQSLAVELTVSVPGGRKPAPLKEFAVEEAALSGVLDGSDIARLGQAPHALPEAVRDSGGRWRRVLADWRTAAAAGLRPEVRVRDALCLFSDDRRQDVARLVRLTAVALANGHEHELTGRACVVAADGRRLRPDPSQNTFADVAGETTGALDVLGIVHDLHPAYAEDNGSSTAVTAWLRRLHCLVRREDTPAVLRIVARLGRTGGTLPHADEATDAARLMALQQALGEMPKAQRNSLGPGIGRTIHLDGFTYGPDGTEQARRVKPGAAYLPQTLETADGDRFEVAARRTPGLVWVRRSYARSLLSAAQAGGLSRTGFLRLLGVADSPRLTPVNASLHQAYTKTYPNDPRLGLARDCMWFVSGRWSQMWSNEANYTLDDLISSDLEAVIRNIASEKDLDERRRRTSALLRTLLTPLTSSDEAVVSMARGRRKWTERGVTAAMWVWKLRQTPWLEDSRGRLRNPADLTLRTQDTEALYGTEDPDYLHPAIHEALATRTEVLTALGVSGDPDVPRLMERLRELRERRTDDHTDVPDSLRAEALLVYRSLARRLTHQPEGTPQSAVEKEIRYEFLNEALVLTDQGWKRSSECFRGSAILRGLRPFALTGSDVAALWKVLGIPEPGADELIDVLKEISATGTAPGPEHEQVMLHALRRLRDLTSSDDAPIALGLQNRLRTLPLWTTKGWAKGRDRAAFAVADSAIARALADHLPLWKPGGNVQQFADLFKLLRVTPLDAVNAEVLCETDGQDGVAGFGLNGPADMTLTEDFRRGITALQDLLVRDEPETAEAFTGWSWLATLEVRLLPDLRIRFAPGGAYEPIELPVDAHIDRSRNTLLLSSYTALTTKAGAGAAIAAHFEESRTRVGHGWRDVWEDGLTESATATALTSAAQRDREDQQRLTEELHRRARLAPAAALPSRKLPAQRGSGTPHVSPASATGPAPVLGGGPAGGPSPSAQAGPQPAPHPRPLVDSATFNAPPGKVSRTGTAPGSTPACPGGAAAPPPLPRVAPLPHPRPGGAPPRNQASPLDYTDHDKEELVLDALGRILEEEGVELSDQRGTAGVGADAYDSTGRYYEIKAHGRAVPSELNLTRSEFIRAWSEGENYTLVIASHLEEGAGRPTLRLVNDPLKRFEFEPPTDVRLKGVRDMSVESTVYEWPATD